MSCNTNSGLSDMALKAMAMRVAQVWADQFGVTLGDVFGKGRLAKVAAARHMTEWTLRVEGFLSYPEIGRAMGVHHTSVMHGVAQARKIVARHTSGGFLLALGQACMAVRKRKGAA